MGSGGRVLHILQPFHDSPNRQGGTSLKVIVHESPDLATADLQVAHHSCQSIQISITWLDDPRPVVPRPLLDSFPVGAVQADHDIVGQLVSVLLVYGVRRPAC